MTEQGLSQSQSAGAAFSASDLEEIDRNMGIEPEEVAAAGDSSDTDIDAADDDVRDTGDAAGRDDPDIVDRDVIDVGSRDEDTAEIPDNPFSAEKEKAAKDMFFSALNKSVDMANERMTKKDPFGKYDGLDFKENPEIYRPFSDQIFDRLCDVPMFKRWLFALNESTVMKNYGAIMMGAYSIYKTVQEQNIVRMETFKAQQAQRQAEQQQAEGLKEKAA